MNEAAAVPWLAGARIGQSGPLSEEIYREIRSTIISGDVAPGTTVQEPLVAAHFGVSRTPVREALLRLRGDGLVVIKKQSGTFVAPIDPGSVEEGILVREALEPRVAEVAADRLREPELAALERETFTMKTAAAQNEKRLFIAADDRFHRVLMEASGFPHIAEIVGRVSAQLDRVRFLSAANRRRAQKAIKEHQAIVEALRSGDGERTAELLGRHLEASWVDIRKIVQGMPSPK